MDELADHPIRWFTRKIVGRRHEGRKEVTITRLTCLDKGGKVKFPSYMTGAENDWWH
jgi:hypothetical protein